MSKTIIAYVFATSLSLFALAGPCSAQANPYQLTLDQFTDCVGPNLYNYDHGTGICQLIPNDTNGGFYILNSTINVTRSSILVAGQNFSTAGLQRGNSSMDAIMSITGDNVTVYFLDFNGSGSGNGYFGEGAGSIPTCSDTCDQYLDLDVASAGTGPENVVVLNCFFEYSPNYSVQAWANIEINSSTFEYVGYSGIFIYGPSAPGAGNVLVEGSSFIDNGGSGIAVVGLTGSQNTIEYNYLINTHYLCFDSSPGGQIYVDPSSSGISVYDNNVNASTPCPNGYGSQGLEMYGTNHTVDSNTFQYQVQQGITIASGNGISVTNNTIENNGQGGLAITGQFPGTGCIANPETYTVSGNTIESNSLYAIQITQAGCSVSVGPTPLTSYNTISGNIINQ
jgi:parallel beta-helix repeat protein